MALDFLELIKKSNYLLLKMIIIGAYISLALYKEKQWHFRIMALLKVSLHHGLNIGTL